MTGQSEQTNAQRLAAIDRLTGIAKIVHAAGMDVMDEALPNTDYVLAALPFLLQQLEAYGSRETPACAVCHELVDQWEALKAWLEGHRRVNNQVLATQVITEMARLESEPMTDDERIAEIRERLASVKPYRRMRADCRWLLDTFTEARVWLVPIERAWKLSVAENARLTAALHVAQERVKELELNLHEALRG